MSKGTVGAKTKFIYKEMHTDTPSGTKELIELSPDYAIVSAGINDAVAKMGAENYCHHYNLIIKTLFSAGIKPIIIDMPQVDYKAVYQRESTTAKIRHHISSWITAMKDSKTVCHWYRSKNKLRNNRSEHINLTCFLVYNATQI